MFCTESGKLERSGANNYWTNHIHKVDVGLLASGYVLQYRNINEPFEEETKTVLFKVTFRTAQ
jgi:hypothetical protein